ncbi:hypothetical protein KDL29_01610 [bacterium]|nr:hypothetical protein [bacterium]
MTAHFKGPELLAEYNYAVFAAEGFEPLMRFEQSPPPGSQVADFQLTVLATGERVSMQEVCRRHLLTVFEFGSVT